MSHQFQDFQHSSDTIEIKQPSEVEEREEEGEGEELLPYPKSKPQDDLEGRNPPTPSRRRYHSNRRVDRDADCSSSKIPKPSLSPLRPRLGLDRVLYELQQYGILGSESYNGPVCFNCCGCHSLSCCPEKKVERVIRRNVALFRKTIKPTTM
jgi:hypothetical protein